MAKTNNQVFTWIIIVAAAYFLFTSGALDMFSAGNGDVDNLYPSDLKTTVTLNTGDALATSATQATVNYYVFTSDGNYLKEGTTSSGTASFTVPTAGHYKLIAYYDATAGGGTSDYLAYETTFSTDGNDPTGRAVQTVNMDLYKESNATIQAFRDPVDLDSNITVGAGQAVHFDILISATTAHAAVGKPVFLIDLNSSEFSDVKMSGVTKVSCPDRVSTAAQHKHYCFQYSDMITSDSGIMMFTGTLYADSSNAPTSNSLVNATVIDTGLYLEPNYKTVGYSALRFGTENPISNADVGAADTAASSLTVD